MFRKLMAPTSCSWNSYRNNVVFVVLLLVAGIILLLFVVFPDRIRFHAANLQIPSAQKTNIGGVGYAHSLSLGGGTGGDLLNAELVELQLQLLELLGELILVLAPELTSLDLGRLQKKRGSSAF